MLDMGFIPDIERICKLVPFTRQTLFFTATMPPEIQRITEQFLHNPVRVEVSRPATTVAATTQLLARSGRDPHRQARHAAPPDPLGRGAEERHHFLQPQARRRDALSLAAAPRLFGAGAARRHGPARAHGGARSIPQGRSDAARRLRCCGPRPRYSGREPHLQFRRAVPSRRLRAPDRPHRPRRPQRHRDHHRRRLQRRQGRGRDREADRTVDPLYGKATGTQAPLPSHRPLIAGGPIRVIIRNVRARARSRASTTPDRAARRRLRARAATIPTLRTCPPSCCGRYRSRPKASSRPKA